MANLPSAKSKRTKPAKSARRPAAKNFTLSEAGTREGLEWLNATPKAKDSQFQQISIGLRNGTPEAMELRDAFGQTSILSFKKFEKNPALGAQEFKFVVPKGADVFKN